ncbi:MAG: hypothetical protein HJJLKODD_00905 [Phycisphaerae bacterium]|nr:hypothetical protein [Phycisphaerae bacterium]
MGANSHSIIFVYLKESISSQNGIVDNKIEHLYRTRYMQVEYIGHAALRIDTGDTIIVTDPWLMGPAYCGQWHLFPKPVNADIVWDAEVILISHGHEDHLHEPTLRHLPKSARIFYPYNWYAGSTAYFHDLGFRHVTEAVTYRTYPLTRRTRVTYVANNLDSIAVIEHDDRVMVNINDALHAHHDRVIDLFIDSLRKRWPKIDTVFCCYGGASFFPNCYHHPGKEDVAIGELREQLFAHNFCKIVQRLQPRVAVPFAADFVLLSPHQHWINQIRFSKEQLAGYFQEFFAAAGSGTSIPRIQVMYSGDRLDGDELETCSPYREELRISSWEDIFERQYGATMAANNSLPQIDNAASNDIKKALHENIRQRAALFDTARLDRVRYCVHLRDVSREPYYHIAFEEGLPRVWRSDRVDPESLLCVETTSERLRYSMASEWGGDVLTIGYGCELNILSPRALDEQLDHVCIDLLTRHPRASRYAIRRPVRALRYLTGNPLTRAWAWQRVLPSRKRQAAEGHYDPSIWLSRTKCDICRICDLPLMDRQFAAAL